MAKKSLEFQMSCGHKVFFFGSSEQRERQRLKVDACPVCTRIRQKLRYVIYYPGMGQWRGVNAFVSNVNYAMKFMTRQLATNYAYSLWRTIKTPECQSYQIQRKDV